MQPHTGRCYGAKKGLKLQGPLGLAAGLLIRGGAPPPSAQPLPAAETSPKELRSFAAAQGHAVYWAGTLPGRKLELTENRSGDVFVRYLTPDAPLGDRRPEFTTVGTYPLKIGAYDVATGAARKKGMVSQKARGGGIAVWSRQRQTSVYLAYPDPTSSSRSMTRAPNRPSA